MDLKKLIKEALAKKARKYEYGCVMVDLNVDKKQWADMQSKIDDDDLYQADDNGGYGKEMTPHITILFGVHGDVEDKEVEDRIKEIHQPEVEIGKVSSFENKLFDVLKFDINSPELHELNKLFKELPHTSDYPDYHPHITICYLKKGKLDKYLKMFKDIELSDAKLGTVRYSKPDGSEKKYTS